MYYLEDLITEKIENEHWMYKGLSVYLKCLFPSEKGLSVRSLERYGLIKWSLLHIDMIG